jgi:AraC-like DNA-binding protein
MYGFLDLLAFASSCSLITMGIVYLSEDRKKADRVIVFTFFLLWGTDTFFILWEEMGLFGHNPHFLYLIKPFELFYGPLVYYRFRILIEGKIKFDILLVLLFLPGVLAVIYFIPYFTLVPQEKLAYIGIHNILNGSVWDFIYFMIARGVTPWLVFCIILFIVQLPGMLSAKGLKLIMRKKIIAAYNILWIVIAVTGYSMYILGYSSMTKVMIIITNGMIILFYYIEKKYEKLFLLIHEDSSETRYKKSMIRNINTGAVIERVKELMELENLYLDENLSLQSLSSLLGITAHQLSEILNDRLNTNFRSFINSYRVKAAKKMILENEDINIIQVAYECGFKSKNGFNNAFNKIEAMTPSEFKGHLKKPVFFKQ